MSETDDRDRRRDPADHPETQDETAHHPTEHTPLLPSSSTSSTNSPPTGTGSSRRSLFSFLRPRRAHPNDYTANVGNRKPHSAARWPSIFALILLSTLVICIIIFYFLAPSLIESYAHQAAFFHPTTLSLLAYTPTGASLRLTGDFSLNASRVRRKPTRDLGRAFTALVQKVETGEANVEVVLPEYGNVVVGTAKVPGVKVDLRDGRRTHVDVEVDTQVGDMEGLKRIIGDWVDGRLGALRVRGTAKMSLRSGIFGLGRQTVEKEFVLAEDDMPTLPPYQIQGFRLSEVDTPSPPPADDDDEKPKKGIAAFISLLVQNDYPLTLTLPPLAFDLLVANCDNHPIPLALASTPSLPIHAHAPLELNATALIPSFPEPLIHPCPKTPHSPLDVLLHRFLRGRETTIYVRGATTTAFPSTPTWLADFLRDIVVPLPVPGKTFTGNLIRNFSMENTSFHLPDPFATPGTPAANPQISADVRALVALPDGTQHVPLNVSRVRAAAEVLYHGAKVGNLDLRKWQEGRSSQVNESEGLLEVWSRVERAPLEITDEDVFAEVVRDLVWGTHGAGVVMGIKAEVDVEVRTVLGKMKIRGIPAKGQVPLKAPFPRQNPHNGNLTVPVEAFHPHLQNLTILSTRPTGLTLAATLNLTNPTTYTVHIPSFDLHLLASNTTAATLPLLLGHATAKNVHIVPGVNENVRVEATYEPPTPEGREVGREVLSRYISGERNVTLIVRPHEGTFPSQPALGRALQHFPVTVPVPRFSFPSDPSDPSDDPPAAHFLSDATFHLLTSTATFLLHSPLNRTTLYITSLNATAYHRGEPAGYINYDIPFPVPPGTTLTPKIPVEWEWGSVGYDAVKRALGGRLKLGAYAEVGLRIGRWEGSVWFKGRGIGAGVRL